MLHVYASLARCLISRPGLVHEVAKNHTVFL